jgi:hypothetical protein
MEVILSFILVPIGMHSVLLDRDSFKERAEHMERQNWNIPDATPELWLTNLESRVYIDICRDLFNTFHALKKILDEWETTVEPGKIFIKEACRILALIDEMEMATKNRHFAAQVTRQVYFMVFCSDRSVHAALAPDKQT